jgi:hypothetical protein
MHRFVGCFLFIFILSTVSFADISLLDLFKEKFIEKTYYEIPENNIPFPTMRPEKGRSVFIFDPNHRMWAIYNKEGKRVGAGPASGGKDYCPDINKPCRTVSGEFTVFRTEDKDCTSKTFPIKENGGAPMPHCMFFYKGYAIHGSANALNKNTSHGCIRVSKKAAEWINKTYISPGSTVIVLPYA